MNAAIISLGSKSSRWTYERMLEHFSSVDMIDIRKIEVNLGKEPSVLYEGKKLKDYDCIYVKGSFKYATVQRALTVLLSQRSYMPIKASAFSVGHNKILTQLKLQHAGIPTPQTYISSSIEAARKLLEEIPYPIIMKFPEGTQGKGVMYADSFPSASSILDALSSLNQPFIIQEYIETGGSDIRAIVVGNEVVAAMRRIACEGEKRANIHAGGCGEAVVLSDRTRLIAVKTAEAVGCDICAVDILESPKGPLVIEINLSPGLQGITASTRVDVAEHIAAFLSIKSAEFKEAGVLSGKEGIIKELGLDHSNKYKKGEHNIITNADIRGSRMLLPELVTKFSGITENSEISIKVSHGKVTIEAGKQPR